MKYECTSKTKNGVVRYKFVCPKMNWIYDKSIRRAHRQCCCKNPCTTSRCGRMVYIYPEKDLRAYPGAIRGTEEWDNTYKIRTVVERGIYQSISASPGAEPRMKHSMQISSLQESPNSLPLFLLIKSTATNTFEA